MEELTSKIGIWYLALVYCILFILVAKIKLSQYKV